MNCAVAAALSFEGHSADILAERWKTDRADIVEQDARLLRKDSTRRREWVKAEHFLSSRKKDKKYCYL